VDPLFQALFAPRAIAFFGASTSVFKWGFNILHHIIRGGFAGQVYPINPQGGDWFGRTVYTGLDQIEGPIDLAVIVVKETLVPQTIRECVARKIPVGIVITAGFSETGESGAALEHEVVNLARAGGMRLVGPNTMGIFSATPSPLQILMTGMFIPQGRVSIIAQSGNLGSSLAYRLLRRSIGLARLVSSGNEADLKVEDYLSLLQNDQQTQVICLYIEGVRDGQRFFETAHRITPHKPIVLLKGGRTAIGAQAAASHTGAMASDESVFDAMCRQAGIIMVDTMDDMIDVAGMLLTQPLPTGNRIGIVTMGGGWGVIATDACESRGLRVPPLEDTMIAKLDAILPAYWSRGNPIDLVAPGTVNVITDTVKIMMESCSFDAVLLMGLGYMTLRAQRMMSTEVIPADQIESSANVLIREEEKLFGLLLDLLARKTIPIIPVIDLMAFDAPSDINIIKTLDGQGIMAYPSPERAIMALAKITAYQQRRAS
jgi:acyl-CoA synthetase (NDP forming)